MKQTVIRFF